MTHRQQSNLVAVITILAAIFFLISSFSIKIDSGYPKVICIAIIVFAVISILETVSEARTERQPHRQLKEAEMTTEELAELRSKEVEESVPWQDLVVVIAVAFLSLILWNIISFLFAGALAILALSMYKKRPVLKSVLLAVCTVVVLQLVFRNIFTIPLPSPSWWPYF